MKNYSVNSLVKERNQKNLAALFHWMKGAMADQPDGYGLNATEAIDAASALSNEETYRCAKKNLVLEPGTPNLFKPISPENLRKAWYKKIISISRSLKSTWVIEIFLISKFECLTSSTNA